MVYEMGSRNAAAASRIVKSHLREFGYVSGCPLLATSSKRSTTFGFLPWRFSWS